MDEQEALDEYNMLNIIHGISFELSLLDYEYPRKSIHSSKKMLIFVCSRSLE